MLLQQWDPTTANESRPDWLSAIAWLNATRFKDDPTAADDLFGPK